MFYGRGRTGEGGERSVFPDATVYGYGEVLGAKSRAARVRVEVVCKQILVLHSSHQNELGDVRQK